jgi:hypothetical protein
MPSIRSLRGSPEGIFNMNAGGRDRSGIIFTPYSVAFV